MHKNVNSDICLSFKQKVESDIYVLTELRQRRFHGLTLEEGILEFAVCIQPLH